MKKITLSFQVIAAIIAVTILQVCAGTAAAGTLGTCATPTLNPKTKTGAGSSVPITIATTTTGAYLVLTVDSSAVGIQIKKQSKTVTIYIPKWGKTVISAIATKSGWTDSTPVTGTYHY